MGNGIDEVTAPTSTRETDAGQNLYIANDNTAGGTFDGFIDNLKVSDKIRPSSEAITSYNAEKSDSDIITTATKKTQ